MSGGRARGGAPGGERARDAAGDRVAVKRLRIQPHTHSQLSSRNGSRCRSAQLARRFRRSSCGGEACAPARRLLRRAGAELSVGRRPRARGTQRLGELLLGDHTVLLSEPMIKPWWEKRGVFGGGLGEEGARGGGAGARRFREACAPRPSRAPERAG